MKKAFITIGIAAICFGFTSVFFGGDEAVFVPASRQRDGDSKKGFAYLTTGDYLKSGIPLNYFKLGFGKSSVNYLQREGLNQNISYEYTAVTAPNGEIVVAPNCL